MIKFKPGQLRDNWWDKVMDVYRLIPYDYRLGPMWQRVKDLCWNRYSTVKPRTLDHSWCDRRELLLHMSMEILGQFIEKECSPGHVIWYGEGGSKIGDKFAMDEMKEIWDWWNIAYQKHYPESTNQIWELITRCGAVCEDWRTPLDKPHPNMRTMVFHFETDEQEAKYRALTEQARELEQTIEDQSDEMLQRLAAVRQYMWT